MSRRGYRLATCIACGSYDRVARIEQNGPVCWNCVHNEFVAQITGIQDDLAKSVLVQLAQDKNLMARIESALRRVNQITGGKH